MEPILTIREVTKEFFSRGMRIHALDRISTDVAEGEFLTIVGPSGCGKSTLLNLIVGLLQPSSGQVQFKGKRVNGINTEIGYVTQKDNLLPWRTLLGNVELAMEVRGFDRAFRRKRAEELIARVGLAGFASHYPHELS
ncbi:MAG: ATP-binding cassette domain-containing protein, partial [Deltaproteobacteria bacterium]|nr:ATP-binding cassette domain-containing protein [Deltaproteobacteria bacterium]